GLCEERPSPRKTYTLVFLVGRNSLALPLYVTLFVTPLSKSRSDFVESVPLPSNMTVFPKFSINSQFFIFSFRPHSTLLYRSYGWDVLETVSQPRLCCCAKADFKVFSVHQPCCVLSIFISDSVDKEYWAARLSRTS
ncbi:hypothetical protein AVEN_232509-1, partial [Araneus ventricosus]